MNAPTIPHGSLVPTFMPGLVVIAPLPPEIEDYCPAFAELPPRLLPVWRRLIPRVARAPLAQEEHTP